MRAIKHIGRLLTAVATLVMLLSSAQANETKRENPVIKGIQAGLSQSPHAYLAGVIEVVGEPRCEKPEEPSSCVSDTKLVDVFSSKGKKPKVGMKVPFRGAAEIGTRFLAFLVPTEKHSKVYTSTFLAREVSEEDDRKTFVKDLAAAGLDVELKPRAEGSEP